MFGLAGDVCVWPGLCGAAQCGVGSPPNKYFHACVHQEHKTATEERRGEFSWKEAEGREENLSVRKLSVMVLHGTMGD